MPRIDGFFQLLFIFIRPSAVPMRLQVDGSTQHTMPNTTSPVGAVEPFESPDDPTSSAAPERRESERVITDWEEETRRLGRALALMELDFSAMTGPRWAHRFIISVGRVAGWLAQIGLFVLFGLYASPERLLDAFVPALIAGAVLLLLARPLSVVAAAAGFRVPWREQVFLSWAGLRGAVPIVLALIPLTEGLPGARELVDAVFVLVVVLTLVQGTSLPAVANLLGLTGSSRVEEIEVDAAPLDALRAALLQMTVPVGSKLHGVEIFELRLPAEASIPLIVIMVVAITSTKLPIWAGHDIWIFHMPKLARYGFWSMAHEARDDFLMLLGSIYLLIAGAGAWSLDALLARERSPLYERGE